MFPLGEPLSACMVDGFGQFREADYRRSWLLFDQVSYCLAPVLRGPLHYSDELSERLEFTPSRAELSSAAGEAVARAALSDATEPTFKALVAAMPEADADIAAATVMSDQEAYQYLRLSAPPTHSVALAFLLNKLLVFAETRNQVPIVGTGYAADMITWKLRRARADRVRQLPGTPLVLPGATANYAAFAAGLSFGFIDDVDLEQASVGDLEQFKRKNRSLLLRSQQHIVEVSRRFVEVPDDERLSVEVERLRQAAVDERRKLDAEARRGLIDVGVAILGKAVASGVSAFTGGLVLTLHPGPAVVAGAVAAATAGIPDALGLYRKVRNAKEPACAYLFRLGNEFSLESLQRLRTS